MRADVLVLGDELVREKAQRLTLLHDRITSCHVVIERPGGHHHKGDVFEVRIHVAIPGSHLDVGGDGHGSQLESDAYVATRDAFERAERQLEDLVRVKRA